MITAALAQLWVFTLLADHFNVTAPAAVTSGTSFPVVVTALDKSNVAFPSYLGTAHFTASDIAASLPANYPFTSSDAGTKTITFTLKTAGPATVGAVDANFPAISGTSASITVNPPVAVSPSTLPDATYGQSGYSQAVVASGGTGTLSFTHSGSLPPGMTFNDATGVLNGTPTAVGAFNFTVTSTDSLGATGSHSYTLTTDKAAPVLSWATPPDITYGTALDATTLNASSNIPGTFTYTPNTGIVLNAGGSQTLSASFTPNDTVNYTAGNITVKVNVLKKALVVTPGNFSRAYGAENPAISGTIIGIQNGDNITATYATSATASSAVGAYAIVPTLFDPNNRLNNYTVTSNNGTLTVTAASLIVGALSASRTYGAPNPVFSGLLLGVLNGDNILAVYNTTATPATVIGNYAITPSLLDPDGKSANYSISLSNGTLTVTVAPLSVTAADVSRTYGSENPPLTGTLAGVQYNDNIAATYSTTATPSSAVGTYSIVPSLADPDLKLANYTVTSTNGTLTVGQAALSVTPADVSKTFGDIIPDLSGIISGAVNGDSFTATYSTTATASSAPGPYPIMAMLDDPGNPNYAVTLNTGTLTILKAVPAITWPAPASIIAGVPLSSTQLNAGANDPISGAALTGTYVYTPAAGTVLAPGLGQSLSVAFTPDDAVDYISASANNSIDVLAATPVAITSAPTVSGTTGTSFAYAITTTGSAPITFGTSSLPAGLTLNVDTISGTPTAAGVYDITLSASNYANTATQPLKLVIVRSTGTNHAPAFTSPPKASANPATTGVAVTLMASATDADGDALDYTWDFGDGTAGLGASVTKTYAAPGVYIVNVVVSDGQASETQSVNLIVEDAPPTGTFLVQKVSLAFNFIKSGADSLSVSGTIPLPPAFVPSGKTVRILIGSLDKSYVLTSKGASLDKAFSLNGKPKNGSVAFSYELKKQNLFAALEEIGFSKTQSSASLIFPVLVELDGKSYLNQPIIKYTAKSNTKGPVSGQGKK